jgi:hypothetical protein
MGKLEEKRPLGRPRCRLEDGIRMEIGWWSVEWIQLPQDRDRWQEALANTVITFVFCRHGVSSLGS